MNYAERKGDRDNCSKEKKFKPEKKTELAKCALGAAGDTTGTKFTGPSLIQYLQTPMKQQF